MKSFAIALLGSVLFAGVAMVGTGCETTHTSSTDKPGLFGGNTHTETKTTENKVTGDVSTEHTVEKTK